MSSHSPNPREDLLARFRQAHPDGGVDVLRTWAAEQPELAGDSERIEGLVWKLEDSSRGGALLEGLLPSGHGPDSLRLFGRWGGGGAEPGSDAAVRTSGPELRPGRQIGRFELIERIGSGGMGQVWAAEDTDLRRRVALFLTAYDLFLWPVIAFLPFHGLFGVLFPIGLSLMAPFGVRREGNGHGP